MKPRSEHMFPYDPVNVQRTDYANVCSYCAASYVFLFFYDRDRMELWSYGNIQSIVNVWSYGAMQSYIA